MKKRNTNATCGTCPYWYRTDEELDCGECRVNAPAVFTFESGEVEFHLHARHNHWCGQHPDFWEAEAEAEQGAPDCEPHALERIAAVLETHLKLLQGGPILYGEVETAAEQDVTNCEPHALEEIARLLNDGEDAEALKELRRMHGLVDRFVCTNCGNVSSSTGHGFACRECGDELTARVVIEQEEDAQ